MEKINPFRKRELAKAWLKILIFMPFILLELFALAIVMVITGDYNLPE